MTMVYKLVGYDRATELVAAEHVIPDKLVERAKHMAGIGARPEIIGDWPLNEQQARVIGAMIDATDIGGRDWFLEPYSETVREGRSAA
jgi:hypothetical protein